ncbi:Holliday junction resolvase [Corynebacterium kutscheri]|uniref:Putative pre-16S rRNA nuclease n=1 Tax=Corynebacterium kutscheri TaxID=35755 RepID=A0A0F6R1Z4_9CORY|nr:Holliday junction resolvase RuvX [Corynebacterium kutscheri]AKE41323.1 RNAse H-fold protein YqgF [Corynebacterium kutscheri]VEH08599.1 Holliday junction resolvase [Corynebacterium kutscheri]VEH09645.1 Holliday junction resolvase [Corynebacterium kutscheri]VEH79728.1 Holliday junction resolvase [Corynebacterium kutscheri]
MDVIPDKPGHNDPGVGRRLGIDVGTVRIGIAVSDRDAIMATPVETVPRKTDLCDSDQEDIDRIIELVSHYEVVEVVVGLPRDLKGNGSQSVRHATTIAKRIARRIEKSGKNIPVRLGDERLTTVVATHALRAAGVKEKAGRKVIDQVAAVEILQSWLDGRRNTLRLGE